MAGRAGLEEGSATGASVRSAVSSRSRLALAAAVVVLLAAGAFAFLVSRDGGRGAPSSSGRAADSSVVESASAGASARVSGSSSTMPSVPGGTETPRSVPAGSKLATVPTAPPRTLGSLRLTEGVSKARLAVVFEIYGWAPNGPDGSRRLAVHVIDSKPAADAGSGLQDLSGENAVFSLASYEGSPLGEGGRYEGTLEVRANGEGRGVMYLVTAKPVH